MGPKDIDAVGVLLLVIVENGIALIVIALADQPAEDMRFIGRICDSGVLGSAIECSDIVLRYGSPVCIPFCLFVHRSIRANSPSILGL